MTSFCHQRLLVVLAVVLVSCGTTVDSPPPAASDCDTYCVLANVYCREANLLFASPAECQQICATFAVIPGSSLATGNTLQCRLNYLMLADKNPRAFCLNAGPSGGVACN